jgi:VWFA-related protein
MKKQKGRKALIVMSDGVDNASKETLSTAIESAQRADTLVYSILFSDSQAYGNNGFGGMGGGGMGGHHGGMGRGGGRQAERPDGKKVLERLAKETGGSFFEVSKKLPIEDVFSRIEEELRNQYSLGYTPERADASSGYHRISLTTTQKALIVQTRDGYYAR